MYALWKRDVLMIDRNLTWPFCRFVLVSGADVHSFLRIANTLLVFGLLKESKDGQNCRKLETPLNIEQDDKYIDFMRKLECCL